MCDQLNSFFSNILEDMLSAYRKKYSCNNVLVKCVEDWRSALDKNLTTGCVMMDLSKAFDCLPHGLLLAKLHAYGISSEACSLIKSYLQNRQQRVKVSGSYSSWNHVKQGVPQGSLTGPLLFNIFMNDLFYFLKNVTVYNYADDNSLSVCNVDPYAVREILKKESELAVKWFENNFMQANPDKFQYIVLSRRDVNVISEINICGNLIQSIENVKLLEVIFDEKLNFNKHTTQLCAKASRQLCVLQRLSSILDAKSKLLIFDTFIMSNFSYCPVVWHSCRNEHSSMMEKIQKRAIRFVCNDFTSDYKELLRICNRPMLHSYLNQQKLFQAYKILHKLAPPIPLEFYTLKDQSYNMRQQYVLKKPYFDTIRYGFNSFKYQSILLWNRLPNDMKVIKKFSNFKNAIQTWDGWKCECGSCFTCMF